MGNGMSLAGLDRCLLYFHSGVRLEVIVTIVSTLPYFNYLWDLPTLHRTITYPTKRDVRKIIDPKVTSLMGHLMFPGGYNLLIKKFHDPFTKHRQESRELFTTHHLATLKALHLQQCWEVSGGEKCFFSAKNTRCFHFKLWIKEMRSLTFFFWGGGVERFW